MIYKSIFVALEEGFIILHFCDKRRVKVFEIYTNLQARVSGAHLEAKRLNIKNS